MHFSPTILYALIGVRDKLLQKKAEAVKGSVSDVIEIIEPDNNCFQYSVSVKSDLLNLSIGLEDDTLNSSLLSFTLRSVDSRLVI